MSFLWLESFGIGIHLHCPGKDSRVNPVSQNIYFMSLYIFFFKIVFLRWAGPRPYIPFPPDLILYVNLDQFTCHQSPSPKHYRIGIPLLR